MSEYDVDSSLYIAGWTGVEIAPTFSSSPTKIALFKTNYSGDTLFMKFYKGDAKYIANSVVATPDGGAVIASQKYDWTKPGPPEWDIHLLKVDSLGNYTPMSIGPQPSEKEKYVTIYPNPATKQVTLRFENRVSEAVGVSVFDMAGNLLREFEPGQPTTGGELTLDISGLSPGAYILRIHLDRTSLVKRLVVR